VTAHAIVICADSLNNFKQSKEVNPIKLSAEQKQKLFILQDRIAVAHDGSAGLFFGESDGTKVVPLTKPYFAWHIIQELRRDTSVMYTTAHVANILRDKLIAQFKCFDVVLKSGALKPDQGRFAEDDPLTNFTVAGYDGAAAHVYQLGVGINWNTRSHIIKPVATLYPGVGKNISLFLAGYNDAIQELWKNQNGPITRKFVATFPIEYRALGIDQDLGIDHMITLARGLLAIQIERTPTEVGYPLTIATMTPGNRIITKSYDK